MKKISEIIKFIPTYPVVHSLASLYNAKKEMNKKKDEGYDNYAHRLGMCESAQEGYLGALTGLLSGGLKEIKDIIEKTSENEINKENIINNFQDSIKDLKNNFEGLSYGLKNKDKSCQEWLKNFDYKKNKWRKK